MYKVRTGNLAKIVKGIVAFSLLLGAFAFTGASTTQAKGLSGAVYVLSNSAAGNSVLLFDRDSDGSLTPAGSVSTGGLGTGTGLGTQGALVLSENNRWLFAVNAGSNEISSFEVQRDGLRLVDKVPSGGTTPGSLTVNDDLLYVLNTGGAGNITGFTVGKHGSLTHLPNSTRPLSGSGVGPAEVQFSPSGKVLVVTEKATNIIDTYTVGKHGLASGPNSQPSAGATPFGFTFGRHNELIVTEAHGGSGGLSATSSYNVSKDGTLSVISASEPTHQAAACWVVVTNNGRHAYTTNAGSGTISGYEVSHDGSLSLLDPSGASASTGAGSAPTDAAVDNSSHHLYVLTSGTHTIAAFAVQHDGGLTSTTGATGIPAGASGIAAR